jgi:hypothetical protein
MPTQFDRAKCAQRNRLAARRDQVDALPFTFLRQPPGAAQEAGLRYAHGTLPASPEAALERINALLPPDKPPLTGDQVYIHYLEAANNRYIGERDMRPMFLGDTTLRNIAADAAVGIAFMNSHRTGGMSHPADLPMGKTFAGRYEEYQDGSQRAVVGIYMLRGVHPNGANGPSTDDLHANINGGTQDDVSVGLSGGEKICDICGEGVNATKEEEDSSGEKRRVPACVHVPGTTHKMTKDQVTAQKARGVKPGTATYTLHHARCGEISAVYDGAVPGAGFAKALRFAADLTPTERHQARAAYATLLKRGDFPMDDLTNLVADGFERAMVRLGLRDTPSRAADPVLLEAMATPLAPLSDPRVPELEAENARLQQEVADRRADRAAAFAATAVTAGMLPPAVAPELTALHMLLASGATPTQPVTFTNALGTEQQATGLQLLTAVFAGLPTPPITREVLQTLDIVPAQRPDPDPEARKIELLKRSPLGQTALKAPHQNGRN